MSKLIVTSRYAYFTFLVALLLVQLGLSASMTSYHYFSLQRQIAVYSVFVSVLGLLLTSIVMCVDVLRENALFSRVVIEVSWLGVLFVLEIAAAAALTAVLPQLTCPDSHVCDIFGAATGISWVVTLTVLCYLLLLLTCTILHHEAYPHVWKTGVRDFPWFMNSRPGSRLPSRPNSPNKPKVSKPSKASNVPKEPFYRKHSEIAQPPLVAPQPRYFMNPILPDEFHPTSNSTSTSPAPVLQIAPIAHLQTSPRFNADLSLEFLNKEVDSRGRPTVREDSPRPLSRRPSRKRPPPLDLSQVSSLKD